MIKTLLAILLIFGISGKALSFQGLCLNELDQLASENRLLVGTYDRNFEAQQKEGFLESIDGGGPIPPFRVATLEQRVALIDSVLEQNQTISLNLSSVMDSSDLEKKKSLAKLLDAADFGPKFSGAKAEILLEALYDLTRDRPYINISFSKTAIKEEARATTEKIILKGDLLRGLQRLRLVDLVSPSEIFKSWKSTHPVSTALITSTSLNLLIWHYFGIFGVVPRFNLLKGLIIPEHLLDKVRREGFDACYEELKPYLNKQILWNKGLQASLLALQLGTAGMVGKDIAKEAPTLWAFYQMEKVDDRKLSAYQDQTFDPQKLREDEFLNWKKAFYVRHKRWPNPLLHPEDRAEWNTEYDDIVSTPDEDLKLNL